MLASERRAVNCMSDVCSEFEKWSLHREAFKDMMETRVYYIYMIRGERIE